MITSMTRYVHSFPWLKFPHREYLISISYAVLKTIERLAFLELAMYAHTQPNKALPNNDKALAGWAKLSINQWLKVKENVFTEWLLVDGFWLLPDWFVVADKAEPVVQAQEGEPKKAMTNAERQAAYKARQAELALLAEQSNVTGNGDSNAQVTESNGTGNEEVTASNGEVTDGNVTGNADFVTFGGKGEDSDLDLNQDLDSKKSNTAPNNLTVIVPPLPIDPVLPVQSEPVQEPTKKPSRKRVTVEVLTEKDLMTTYGVLPKYAKDWLAIRDSRKAKLTGSAMELLISQSELAGITIAQAVEVCAKKGWTGFNATWNYSDIIPIQKTANDSAREKGIAAIIASGQSKPASENFINGMVGIYGDVLVNAAVISAISNKPVDVIEYIGTFLKAEARQNKRPPSKPITGNVNAAFPLAKETKLTPNQIQENKEALDELPF